MMEQLLGGDDRSLDARIKKIRDESGSRINPLRSRPLFPRPNGFLRSINSLANLK